MLAEPELPKIHRLLVRMTGREVEAEDLCQEALLKAWRAVPAFQAKSRFGTWLYRIAINLALSAKATQREIASSPETFDRHANGSSPFSSGAPASAETTAEHFSDQSALRKAIEGLAPRQRAVVHLRVEEELPFALIADKMDLTVGAVKAHYFQATERLRAAFRSA